MVVHLITNKMVPMKTALLLMKSVFMTVRAIANICTITLIMLTNIIICPQQFQFNIKSTPTQITMQQQVEYPRWPQCMIIWMFQ
jgi:hypothetical protein